MNYLKQTHTQLLIAGFILTSIILVSFPILDIQASNLFFAEGFYLKGSWWEKFLFASVTPFLVITVIAVPALYFINKYMHKNIFAIDGKKTMFLILVLFIGPGLIVNVVFKNNFGRARPVDVTEFHGAKHFTSAFVITHECDRNCSFSSGHGAGAFFALALALLFKHRKNALAIAFIYGCLVSLARIAAGRHFISDNIVSFFVVAITTDVLYYLFYVSDLSLNHRPGRSDDEVAL